MCTFVHNMFAYFLQFLWERVRICNKGKKPMPNVFEYTNYREYLEDYYAGKKNGNPHFSYQLFSDKAGFKDKSCLYSVIKGKRSLSKTGIFKISQAIKLNHYESEYFENLVAFNQAKNLKEKNYYYERMNQVKCYGKGVGNAKETRKNQYEFYSNWYLSVIRSLIDMHEFKDDYAWLAKSVYPPIKPSEAKKAVALLQKLELIKKTKKGTFRVCDKTITAGAEIIRLGLLNFQLQTTSLAAKAIQELPRDKRHISGLTLGISKKTYELICKEIELFQERLQMLAENDEEADNVFQLNFHFLPVSNINGLLSSRQT
ncbi:MAG: TIGR02147 family protein [Chitinivibrionales bacterium]|nr:TIGR02147 family protein [Chitinivibrionales bacterium]